MKEESNYERISAGLRKWGKQRVRSRRNCILAGNAETTGALKQGSACVHSSISLWFLWLNNSQTHHSSIALFINLALSLSSGPYWVSLGALARVFFLPASTINSAQALYRTLHQSIMKSFCFLKVLRAWLSPAQWMRLSFVPLAAAALAIYCCHGASSSDGDLQREEISTNKISDRALRLICYRY